TIAGITIAAHTTVCAAVGPGRRPVSPIVPVAIVVEAIVALAITGLESAPELVAEHVETAVLPSIAHIAATEVGFIGVVEGVAAPDVVFAGSHAALIALG